MIALHELNPHKYKTTADIDYNLAILLKRLNIIRKEYGKPMTITSGLRSDTHQKKLIAQGLSNAKRSNHMTGCACDVKDLDGELKDWILGRIPLLEQVGLWCEDFDYTPTWVHFQIVPPKSGKRFFIP